MKISLSELLSVASKATSGADQVERRDQEWGSIDYIVYGGKDFAVCAEMTDSNCKNNANHIAAFNPEVARRLVVGLQDCVKTLNKIEDPRKRDHKEPDEYTAHGCAMNIARECLERLGDISE